MAHQGYINTFDAEGSVMEREALIKRAYELGFDYEKRYHGCSQSTIAAVQDALGVRNDFVFKAAGGLAAGCGLLRDGPCGGYTGGIMVMSMFFARVRKKFDDDREENYCSFRMAVELHDKFIEEYGTIMCREIHCKIFGRSYDLWNPEEKEQFEEAGAHREKCTGVVARASAWALGILIKEMEMRSLQPGDFKHLTYIDT